MSVTLSDLLCFDSFPEHDVLATEDALETPTRARRATQRPADTCSPRPAGLVRARDEPLRPLSAHRGHGMINAAASTLRTAGDTCEDLVRGLADVLRHPVAMVDDEGRLVAGSLPDNALRACAPGQRPRRDVQTVHSLDRDHLLLIQPVPATGPPAACPSVVALVPVMPAANAHTTSQVLSMAMWALAANLATTAVLRERQSKQDAVLLTWLLAEADEPSSLVRERVSGVGWRLRGAHTAIHVRARSRPDDVCMRDRLGRSLAAQGIPMRPIPDSGGWSLWTTREPPLAAAVDLPGAVGQALLAVERDAPGTQVWAGIGTAADGPAGLRTSIQDARRACVLAAGRNRPGAVEYLGGGNARHLLGNHFHSAMHRQLARQLLRPVMAADPSGQLLHTLSCYLDNESSPTAAATALGVHRNTVLQRLDRIRALLCVEFGDADERLALHLATRLVLADAQDRT